MVAMAQFVGIGASHPQAAMYVSHSGDITRPHLLLTDSVSGSNQFISLGQRNSGHFFNLGTTAGFNNLSWTNTSNPTPLISLQGNLGVGINTATPVTTLTINSPVQTALLLNGGSGSYFSWGEGANVLGFIGSYYGNQTDIDFGATANNTTGDLLLATRGVARLTVKADGNVGVGTQVPQQRLSVAGGLRLDNLGNFGYMDNLTPGFDFWRSALQVGNGAFIGVERYYLSSYYYQYNFSFYTNNQLRWVLWDNRLVQKGLETNPFITGGINLVGTTIADSLKVATAYMPNLTNGVVAVGASSVDIKSITVPFGYTFATPPVINLTVIQQTGITASDQFTVSLTNITTTSFTAKVARIDPGRPGNGWGQALKLSWLAMPAQ